ncbi:MAG: cell wall hydrolase [Oscillospiraceae bacterium]|nr:cell wall hydrolase [Oscillospiraceae bacterium]
MKPRYVIATLLCFALIALLLLADRHFTDEPEPVSPPERNMSGLKVQQIVALPEPEYEIYFTDADIIACAKLLWGEARGCTKDNQAKCVWVVCNRVDDPRFPDTITGVITQPSQFHGYDPSYPVSDELYTVALDVLTRWSMEKQGAEIVRELPSTYLYFTGDGMQNRFREAY